MMGKNLLARNAKARSARMTDVKIRMFIVSEDIVFVCGELIWVSGEGNITGISEDFVTGR
jgi:hypothetical protein